MIRALPAKGVTVRRALLLAIMIVAILILPAGSQALAESGFIPGNISLYGDQGSINNTSLMGRNNTTANATAARNVTADIFGTMTGRLAMNVIPGNKTVTLGLAAQAGEQGALETTAFTDTAVRATDAENISIDFPYFKDGEAYGPTAGSGPPRAGILPFGPVNLAFPSIRQSVATTLESESTSFVGSDRSEGMSYPHILLRKTKLPAVYFEL